MKNSLVEEKAEYYNVWFEAILGDPQFTVVYPEGKVKWNVTGTIPHSTKLVLPKKKVETIVYEQSFSGRNPEGKLILKANPFACRITTTKYGVSTTVGPSGMDGVPPSITHHSVDPGDPPLKAMPPEVMNSAIESFYGKLSSVTTNLGEAFATRAQTVDMIAKTANKLNAVVHNLAKKNPIGALKALGIDKASLGKQWDKKNDKSLSGQWLEMQYGWKPLLGDIYSAIDIQPDLLRTSVRQSFQWSDSFSIESPDRPFPGFPFATEGTGFKTSGNLRHYGTIRADLLLTDQNAKNAHEYGLDNPALLAWELLPFSFVADWFIPVGNYLESLGALHGFEVVDSSVTHNSHALYQTEMFGRNTVYDMQRESKVTPGRTFVDIKTKKRTLGIPPMPLPSVKSPLSVTHALNAIALFSETVRTKKHLFK